MYMDKQHTCMHTAYLNIHIKKPATMAHSTMMTTTMTTTTTMTSTTATKTVELLENGVSDGVTTTVIGSEKLPGPTLVTA